VDSGGLCGHSALKAVASDGLKSRVASAACGGRAQGETEQVPDRRCTLYTAACTVLTPRQLPRWFGEKQLMEM